MSRVRLLVDLIPEHWSREQARAVEELLEDLMELLWQVHGHKLYDASVEAPDLRSDPDSIPF